MFLNQSAEFTCETDGDHPSWRVNGKFLNRLPPEMRNDINDTTPGKLILEAKAEYNGTKVMCVVAPLDGPSDGPSVESENVTLTIIGIPL